MLGSLGFAALAGTLSTLSPCVLPILPVVLATAAGQHRYGPAALASGLALSFAALGLFVATIGFAIGLDAEAFRAAGGAILLVLGVVLLSPSLSARAAVAAGPVGEWAGQRFAGVSGEGVGGQFAVGLLLGVVWAPCVGPTLGAASLLAARGENLGQAAATMLAFGVGAAAPLLAIGLVSREALLRWRGRMLAAGAGGKRLLGGALVMVGALILAGLDKRLEAALVAASPDWLTRLTTAF